MQICLRSLRNANILHRLPIAKCVLNKCAWRYFDMLKPNTSTMQEAHPNFVKAGLRPKTLHMY